MQYRGVNRVRLSEPFRAIITKDARINAAIHDFLVLVCRFDQRGGWLHRAFRPSAERFTAGVLRLTVLWIGALVTGLAGDFAAAFEIPDGEDVDRKVGVQMAFECLKGDEQLECLKKKGFRCAPVGEPSRNSYSCYIFLGSGCYRKRFQLAKDGWSSTDDWQAGECEDTFEPVLEPGVRMKFDNTNAPPELVFKLFVQRIFNSVLDSWEDLDALDPEPCHPGLRYVEPGLTGKMESADVVRYFARRYIGIEQEVEDLSKRLLCEGKQPRYAGAENFQIFNQMDDVRLHVYERHLLIARADLQASGLFDVDNALRNYPDSFGATFFDHEAARDGSISMIYEHASRLCEGPWKQTFTSSESTSEDEIERFR